MAEERLPGAKITTPAFHQLKSVEDFRDYLAVSKGDVNVVLFMQDWANSCDTTANVIVELANDLGNVSYAEVIAEDHPDLCEKYNVVGVPTVLFFQKRKEMDRVVGVRVRDVVAKLKFLAANTGSAAAPPTEIIQENNLSNLNDRLKALVSSKEVMIFIKGNPGQPKCGFSRVIMEILNETGIEYGHFDILSDEEVRQGLKTYSNWQTYPQVYVKGELIGGLDIIKELKESGDLLSTLKGE